MAEKITVENDFFRLEFSPITGSWVGFFDKINDTQYFHPVDSNMATIDIKVETEPLARTLNWWPHGCQAEGAQLISGTWLSETETACYISHRQRKTKDRIFFSIISRLGEWQIEDIYRISNEKHTLTRDAKLQYLGKDNAILRGVNMVVPHVRIDDGKSSFYEIYDPWYLGNLRKKFEDLEIMADYRSIRKDDVTISAFDLDIGHEWGMWVHHQKRKLCFSLWCASPDKDGIAYMHEEKSGVGTKFAYHVACMDKFGPDYKIEIGRQYIDIIEGEWQKVLDRFENIKRERGCVVPPAPRWAAESPIYQVHGFGWDFGGFKGLQKMLPDIKELGMKIIYFPPVFPTEGYYNSDFFMISPSFGTEQEFKDLVKAVHKLGMKIIVDFVPNNIDMRTDLVEKHPDWFRVDEEGGILMYGRPVLSMNHTHPGCSKFLIKSCEWLVRKFDIDGFRIDVAGWWPASWKVFPPYKRAGQSLVSTAGWVEKLRARLDKVKPLFYMEEASSGVAGCKYVSHGWIDIKRQIESIKTKSQAAELVERVHYFLQDRILHEPASVLTMFHTIMHDDFGFTLKLRGTMIPPRRATLAFIALMEGVPMFLQGFERGNRDFVRRLFLIRENLATLNHGVSRFCHVKSSNPAVLAFTRHIDDNVTICAINFYNGVAKTTFKLSAELKDQLGKKKLSLMNIGSNVDAFSMEKVTSDELNDIEIGPYGSVVITSEKISAKAINVRINSPVNILAASLPTRKAASGAVCIVEKGRKVIVEAGDTEYRIALDNGGLIESVWSKKNSEKICGPLNVEYEEGLFHEQSQHKKSNTDLILNRWINPGYDDSNWDDVFIMTTAISHIEWERKTKARAIFRPIDDLFLWSGTPQVRNAVSLYRKEFELADNVVHAELKVAVSQSHETYLNNQLIGLNRELWYNPVDVTNKLEKGPNAIGIKVRHNTGCRGPLVELNIKFKSGKKIQILSDKSWKVYPGMRLIAGELSTWKSRKRGKSVSLLFTGKLYMNTVGAISHRYEAPMAFISKSNIRNIEPVNYRIEYDFKPSGTVEMTMTFLNGSTGKASTGTYKISADLVNHTHWIASDKNIGTVHERITDWSIVKGPWSGFPIRMWDTEEFQIDEQTPVVIFCNPDKKLSTQFNFISWNKTMRSYIIYRKTGNSINPQLTFERTINGENLEQDIDLCFQLTPSLKKSK